MKRISGKRLLNNNWVVPASVLILTLCIGSFALASTGSPRDNRYSFLPTSTTSVTTATTQPQAVPSSLTTLPVLGYQTVATSVPGDAATEAQLALEQAKENAILDLIGEQMLPEDKVIFDQLRAVAAQQLQTVTKAQADLRDTKSQISALIDKYLGVPNGVNTLLGNTTRSTTPRYGHVFE